MAVSKGNRDPAEGSEDVIDRQLERRQGASPNPAQALSASELERLLGDIDPVKFSAILALQPSIGDVEEALAWTRGDGDVLGKTGRRLSGKAALVYDIVMADMEERQPAPEGPG